VDSVIPGLGSEVLRDRSEGEEVTEEYVDERVDNDDGAVERGGRERRRVRKRGSGFNFVKS